MDLAGTAPDPLPLRNLVPANPRRACDVRKVIAHLADQDSVLELKPSYGRAVVAALIRLAGRAVGVVANQPMQAGGTIDSAASVKAARFVQICDAYDIPLLLLCDTPGLMVGPEAEKTGLVRHSARLLSAIANATTPIMTVVLRKAYGLGCYIMGSQPLEPAVLLAWPTAIRAAAKLVYDNVIDPIDTRALLLRTLQTLPAPPARSGRKRVIEPF